MYPDYTRKPAWYRDVKWLCGVLLALTVAAGTLLISLAQLTRPELGQRVSNSLLALTLLPDPDEEAQAQAAAAPEDEAYSLGEPLSVIAGIDAAIDPADIETISVEAARRGVAVLLAEDVVAGGVASALERVTDPTLNTQFSQAAQSILPSVVARLLGAALLDAPAELGTGTRLTDWPLQAQQNPNRNVQPIVGVFVTAPPDVLASLTSRQIGEYVVNELGLTLLSEGLPAAQERASREVVRTLIAQSARGDIRTETAELFDTLLIPQNALIAERLAQARAVIAAQDVPADAAAPPETVRGLTPASALEGLSLEEANRRVVSDIASAVYSSDVSAVVSQLNDPIQRAQLTKVASLLNLFTQQQHRRFVRWTYIAGSVALFLTVAFMYVCGSWERFVGTGLSIMAGAALGSFVFTIFAGVFEGAVSPLPAAPPVSGIPGYTGDALRYTVQQLPSGVLELFARNHLVVLATGAGLIILFVIQQLWNAVRPRRRRFL